MKYPAHFEPAEEGGFVITFRDIPEAITQAEDEAEAAAEAASALISAMDFYFEDRRAVPPPSPALQGERLISLPASAACKILLLNEMVAQKVGPSELARRMGTSPQVVNRLVDLHHPTKIDTVEEALESLGKQLELVAA
ncbi:type II toxin-antitoxin system HicB family antitoxin [Duganella dendranthematis]|uniref:Type II toxin-antitoxin system HicB family antitoxin n=1 Tax=Duganella dendranthematis TaxID=2728021 RepID=A0ABX6MBX8_9BURK|nr:type II toxin-antitoxin system HicB family antitoxin [Duganella dendranthematis]QJD91824.1 type II toxin-antitoxin system HicB family antitoxin [Duganella dendranthematis]